MLNILPVDHERHVTQPYIVG